MFPAGGYKQRANLLFPAHLSNCISGRIMTLSHCRPEWKSHAFPLLRNRPSCQTFLTCGPSSGASVSAWKPKPRGFFSRGQANKQRANYAVSDGDLHEKNMKQRTPRISPASFAGETSTKGAPPAGLFSRKARKTKNISCQRVK